MNYLIEPFKKAFDFDGRATRTQYWMFVLWYFLITIALLLPSVLFSNAEGSSAVAGIFGVLLIVWYLALIIPSIAIIVRRLHDTGRSGWWFFIMFVPLIGGIWFFILMVLPSKD